MANETKEEFELIYEENEIKKYFNGLYTLVKNLLILLWEDPKIFATFIMNTNKLNFKKNLSFWVSENFYGNEFLSILDMYAEVPYTIYMHMIWIWQQFWSKQKATAFKPHGNEDNFDTPSHKYIII